MSHETLKTPFSSQWVFPGWTKSLRVQKSTRVWSERFLQPNELLVSVVGGNRECFQRKAGLFEASPLMGPGVTRDQRERGGGGRSESWETQQCRVRHQCRNSSVWTVLLPVCSSLWHGHRRSVKEELTELFRKWKSQGKDRKHAGPDNKMAQRSGGLVLCNSLTLTRVAERWRCGPLFHPSAAFSVPVKEPHSSSFFFKWELCSLMALVPVCRNVSMQPSFEWKHSNYCVFKLLFISV